MAEQVQSTISIEAKTRGVDQATDSLNRLVDAQEGAVVASDMLTKAETSVERAYDRLKRQIDANYSNAQRLVQGHATLTKALNQGQISAEQYQRDLQQLTARFGDAGRGAETAKASIEKIGVSSVNATGALRAMAGILASLGAIQLGKSMVQAAVDIERFTNVANTIPETLQRWSAATSTVGISQEKLADILKDVNDKVGDFLSTGGGELKDFFEQVAPKVGVTADQFKRLSGPDALQLYVSTLEKAGAGQAQMTFFMEAIADDATMLLPLLRNNGSEMERFGDLAKELGAVMGSDTLAAMQRLRESSAQVSMVFEGMRNEVMKELAPSLESLANKFVELSRAGEPVNVAVRAAVENMDRLAIYAGTAGAAVIALNFSLTALRAALIRTGIGAVVVAAGELVYQFVDLVEKAGSVAAAFSHIGSVAVEIFNRVITMGQAMGQALSTVALQFKADFLNAFAWVAQGFVDMMAKMLSPLNAMLDFMGSEPVANFGQNIADGLKESARAAQFAATAGESATKKLLDAATAPLETVKKLRDQVAAASDADAWDNYIKSTNKASGATNKLGGALDSVGGKKKEAKKAAREVSDEYDRWLDKIQDATRQYEIELETMGMSSAEATRYKLTLEAVNAAKDAGRKITPQLTAEIDREVDANVRAKAAIDEHKNAIEALNAVQDLVSATWVRALEDMILNAETLTDAIKGIGDAWSKASLDALLTGKGPLAQFTGLASNDPNNPNAVGGVFGLLMGNQSKLLSQLPKQVQAGAEKGTATGAKEGIDTSFSSGGSAGSFLQTYGKQIGGALAGVTSLVGAYGVGMSGGSMAMSGVGGAISGGMGGLSLASSGLVAGLGLSSAALGGIGAVIGAGISVYANQEAKKQAKQARYEEAQTNYQNALPAMKELSAALAGDVTGTLQQAVDQARSKTHELLVIATNAFRMDEVDRLYKEFDAFEARIGKEFRDVFEGTLDQLSAGGALSGAFSSAKAEMDSFGDELLTWVEDVKKAFNVWSGGEAEQATQAARDAALAMLEPAESISAVQQAIQQVNGRATALADILEDLWMSSDDAARAIDEGVLRAMDALRASFSDDLTAKLYDAQDKGYFNEVRDTLAEVEQMYSDAAALGIDESARIAEYFGLTAQSIVDGAELTGDAFGELVTKFPELSGVVHEFVEAMDDAIQTAAQFNSSMQSKIFGAEGRGYISTAMDLVTERDALRKTAEQIGGDMGLVEKYYGAAAQAIVNSSQLTGDAFAELLAWVPQLNGYVSEFAAAVQQVGKTSGEFYDDIIDKIVGAQGKNYIVDMRGLLKERDELSTTAQQLGVDVGLVNQYFSIAAQNIVDNSQLTGEAFNDLLAWFPQLAGQLHEFSAAAQEVGSTFWDVQNSIIDKIINAQGKGYIVDMRNLIEERDELAVTAAEVGVDLGLVNQYFGLAAQSIVDNANLTGDAFADLIAWFPDLAGSLREAGQAVEQTAAQIEAAAQRLKGYEDRFFSATNDNSSLDGALREFDRNAAADRAAELAAGGQHLVALERALAAERLGVMAQFASQAVSAAQSAVDTARQNLQSAAQAAIDAAQAQVDAAQTAAQAAAQAVSDAQSRVDAAQQALERAQDAVRQGYEDQASVLRDTVSRLQSFIKGIQDFKRSLVLDDALSPFSPAQRLAEAQAQVQDTYARLTAGDASAYDEFTSVARSYLEELRGYYGSSEAYATGFADIQRMMDSAASLAQDQLSEAERQLAALDAQIAALTRIDDTVLSIDQAQAELNAAVADLATAQQQQAQADSALRVAQDNLSAVQSQMDALLGINNSVMSVEQAVRELGVAQSALAQAQQAQADILAQQQAIANRNPNEMFVQQAYRDVFGREADAGGLAYWTNQMDVGASTAAQILERLQWEKANGAMRMGGIVGSYATGGMVGNGMWDMDSVLARYAGGGNIALAGGEYVTRAPSVNRDTLPTLAAINATGRLPSANDDSAKNEIRALRQEVAELKQALVAGFNGTIGAVSQTTSAVKSTENTIGRQRIAR